MSKFDYESFYGGYDNFAVSKEKYTKEQAIEIAKVELERIDKPYYLAVCDAYARHRAGVNEDKQRCVGWWLEYEKYKRSCPVWAFKTTKTKDIIFSYNYEFIEITE